MKEEVGGTIQRHKDTCKSIMGKRRILNGGYTEQGALGVAGKGTHPAPSPLLMGLLTWGSGL